jgi:hypothetical protein
VAKAKPGSDRVHGRKSAAIRALLTENPKMPVKDIVAALADKGMKVNPNLVYFVKGRLKTHLRRQQRRQGAQAGQRVMEGNPVALLRKVPRDLAALPRNAVVAFAARCVRRVLPLIRIRWPHQARESSRGGLAEMPPTEPKSVEAKPVPGRTESVTDAPARAERPSDRDIHLQICRRIQDLHPQRESNWQKIWQMLAGK